MALILLLLHGIIVLLKNEQKTNEQICSSKFVSDFIRKHLSTKKMLAILHQTENLKFQSCLWFPLRSKVGNKISFRSWNEKSSNRKCKLAVEKLCKEIKRSTRVHSTIQHTAWHGITNKVTYIFLLQHA